MTGYDKSRAVTVFGIQYPSLRAAAEDNSANYKKVFHHVRYMSETPEEAIQKLAGKSRDVTIEGRLFPTLKEACAAYAIKYGTVIARMRRGLTAEQAILTPLQKNRWERKYKSLR